MTTAFVVAGIGYGDEGKGTITDALVRRHGAGLVVRYNGGAQAAHNVVTPDGVHHTFAQFGSGALAGAATYLGEHVVVDPTALLNEYYSLVAKGGFTQIAIHPRALLVNPYQVALNRIRELARGARRHGSTGRGIGECVCDSKRGLDVNVIRAGDLLRPGVLAEKLQFWRERKMQDAGDVVRQYQSAPNLRDIITAVETWFGPAAAALSANWFARALECPKFVTFAEPHAVLPRRGAVVFEGAQGVMLDEVYGLHPFSTWSNVTFDNALAMLGETSSAFDVRRIGVTRAYATRHGDGPLPTEDPTWASPPGEHNQNGHWQGPMRYGPFDLVTAEYALDVLAGVDELAVTCIDHLPSTVRYAVRYHDDNRKEIGIDVLRTVWSAMALTGGPVRVGVDYETADNVNAFCDAVSAHLNAPITIRSYGPTFHEKGWAR